MEKREYGPDSSPEEIQMLRDRVYLLNPDTIFFNEAIVMSEFQTETMWERAEELMDKTKPVFLLVDLVDSKPPNARQRAKVKQCLNRFSSHIKHAALYTEKNKLINLVAKFVLGGAGFQEYSIHVKREEALNAIQEAKNK